MAAPSADRQPFGFSQANQCGRLAFLPPVVLMGSLYIDKNTPVI